jgi:hypothetical protein
MMLAPLVFPEWLPPIVAEEARRIFYTEKNSDDDLVLRLATDKRMESVWNELNKYKVAAPSQLESSVSLLARRERPLSSLTDREAALNLFFWYAYAFAFMEVSVGTISSRNLPIARCREAAAMLRLSATRLRLFELSPEFDLLPVSPQDLTPDDFKYHTNTIESAAKFYDEIAGALTKLKDIEAPLVVSKDYGNRGARGYVRMLATETRKLFGTTLIRTLATTASVALSKKVTPTQVRKWTERLPK